MRPGRWIVVGIGIPLDQVKSLASEIDGKINQLSSAMTTFDCKAFNEMLRCMIGSKELRRIADQIT